MYPDQPESDETFDIYFLVEGKEDFLFFRIPDDQPPPSESGAAFLVPVSKNDESNHEFLQPVLKLNRGSWKSAGCAAVGSTIYLFGGECLINFGCGRDLKMELYYFDMGHPEKGWKQGCSMPNPRSRPTGFSVNNRVYAAGGFDLCKYDKPLPIEVYNPEDDSWESKCELPYQRVTDSALYNNGSKQVVMYTRNHDLVVYNVENGSWGFCPLVLKHKVSGTYPGTMTVLGETLYTGGFGYKREFQIIGYDFLNNNTKNGGCCGVEVTGLETLMDERSDYLLPEDSYTIGSRPILSPRIQFLAIGRNRLAVVWALQTGLHLYVNCLKMDIHREEDEEDTNKMKLSARNGSFSSHIVKGPRLECCILVKKDEGYEDELKE